MFIAICERTEILLLQYIFQKAKYLIEQSRKITAITENVT